MKHNLHIALTFILSGLLLVGASLCMHQEAKKESNDVVVIYQDSLNIDIIKKMIDEKMSCDIYELTEDLPDINQYKLCIIGLTAYEGLSQEWKAFLQKHPIHTYVTAYYIGYDAFAFENELCMAIEPQYYMPALCFNDDEISELELVEVFVDEWLTSSYNP